MPDVDGFVYLLALGVEIQHNESMWLPVKIGFTQHPESRFKTILTATPFELITLGLFRGNRADERAYHERFNGARTRREGEWFYFPRLIADEIARFNPLTTTARNLLNMLGESCEEVLGRKAWA